MILLAGFRIDSTEQWLRIINYKQYLAPEDSLEKYRGKYFRRIKVDHIPGSKSSRRRDQIISDHEWGKLNMDT